ncbi:hypothetical protein ACFL4E_01080 [Candidatus Omnitrophota bacterium]
MVVLEWIVWSLFLLGALYYTLGIYLNVTRKKLKIQPGLYAWCAFQWVMIVVFLFIEVSKVNMLWIAPVGFVCIYAIIIVVNFFRGFLKSLLMAGKNAR